MVKSYIKDRLGTDVTSTRVKRDLAYLSSLFNFWLTQPDGPSENILKQLDRRRYGLREGKPRTRWITPDQFEHLLSFTEAPSYRAILILAVETGMRQAAILGLTRQEVDLKLRRIVLGNLSGERTKTSESRIIPLTPRAWQALSDTLCTHRAPFVFLGRRWGRPMRQINYWWPQLRKRAGFDDLRFHDLRHTFTSWASRRGVQERPLQALLGHKTWSMTQRYTHLRVADLERAMEVFVAGDDRPPVHSQEPPKVDPALTLSWASEAVSPLGRLIAVSPEM